MYLLFIIYFSLLLFFSYIKLRIDDRFYVNHMHSTNKVYLKRFDYVELFHCCLHTHAQSHDVIFVELPMKLRCRHIGG